MRTKWESSQAWLSESIVTQPSVKPHAGADCWSSVATAVFSLDLGVFCFIWGSGVFIENLEFFDSGQILEMYVALLYFPFKNTVISQA